MNYYDESQEQYDEIAVQSTDNMPVGAVIEYSGNDVPVGWEKVNDYSETEQDTGKTWVDGKKIYRKVYIGSSYAGTSTIDVGLSNISTMIDIKCTALENSSTNVWFCNYYDSSNAKLSFYFNSSANKIEVWTPASKTYKFTFIMEYTKTS